MTLSTYSNRWRGFCICLFEKVTGLYAWNQLGRRVKKGEEGIRILAPIIGIKRKPDGEAEKDITKQKTRVLVGFRYAYGFARLSRDLWPNLCAPMESASATLESLLDSSKHIIAQLLLPARRSLMQKFQPRHLLSIKPGSER